MTYKRLRLDAMSIEPELNQLARQGWRVIHAQLVDQSEHDEEWVFLLEKEGP